MKVNDCWLKHVPEEVVQHNSIIVMWDKAILTEKKDGCNRPDITVHDTKERECVFVDVSITGCNNVIKKEAEKIVEGTKTAIFNQRYNDCTCYQFV